MKPKFLSVSVNDGGWARQINVFYNRKDRLAIVSTRLSNYFFRSKITEGAENEEQNPRKIEPSSCVARIEISDPRGLALIARAEREFHRVIFTTARGMFFGKKGRLGENAL